MVIPITRPLSVAQMLSLGSNTTIDKTVCHAFVATKRFEMRVLFRESVTLSDLFYVFDDALAADNNLQILNLEVSTTAGALLRSRATLNQVFDWRGEGFSYEDGRGPGGENEFGNEDPDWNPIVANDFHVREEEAYYKVGSFLRRAQGTTFNRSCFCCWTWTIGR